MDSAQRLPASDRQQSLLWLLILFTLGGTVLTLIGEVFKRQMIWHLRFADMVDLVAVAPLYLVCLVLLHDQFLKGGAAAWLRRTFLLLVGVFLYGHAMHMTANTVNCYITEINDYKEFIPADAYALLYFLDEVLSHYVIYISRYALFAALLWLQVRYLAAEPAAGLSSAAIVAGVVFGAWEAIVFVEGQKVLLAPFLFLGLGAVWLLLWRRSACPLAEFVRMGPVTAFVTAELPSLLIGLGLYGALTGGFVEPSKVTRLLLGPWPG